MMDRRGFLGGALMAPALQIIPVLNIAFCDSKIDQHAFVTLGVTNVYFGKACQSMEAIHLSEGAILTVECKNGQVMVNHVCEKK